MALSTKGAPVIDSDSTVATLAGGHSGIILNIF